MLEVLTRADAEVLEHADVAETLVAFQVLNSLSCEKQELLDLGVVGLPQLAVVLGIFDKHFMRAHRRHAVIESLAAALGFALDVVDGVGVDHGPCRPRTALAGKGGAA
jgi:hypothetical protein